MATSDTACVSRRPTRSNRRSTPQGHRVFHRDRVVARLHECVRRGGHLVVRMSGTSRQRMSGHADNACRRSCALAICGKATVSRARRLTEHHGVGQSPHRRPVPRFRPRPRCPLIAGARRWARRRSRLILGPDLRELALCPDQRGVAGCGARLRSLDDRDVLADRQRHLHRSTSRAAGSASVLRSVPSSRRRQAAYRGGPPSRQVGLRPRPACAQSSCRPGYQYEVVTVTSPVMRAQHA